MDAETLFAWCNRTALVGWLMLILFPRRGWSAGVVAKFVIPLLLATIYVGLVVARWPGHRGGFSTLSGVAELFSDRWILLAGWVHYLAFDLFLGAWEVRDATRRGISHWLVVPCLVLTFLFGPAGLLLYTIMRETRGVVLRNLAKPLPVAVNR